jgi:hypothetical protein
MVVHDEFLDRSAQRRLPNENRPSKAFALYRAHEPVMSAFSFESVKRRQYRANCRVVS